MKTTLCSFALSICIALSGCKDALKPHADKLAEAEIKDVEALVKYTDFSQTPAYVRRALDTIDGGKFLIANPGEHWNAGCIQMEGEPSRELIWASVNKGYFILYYNQGGFVSAPEIMRLNFDGEKLTSFVRDGQLHRWTRNELER